MDEKQLRILVDKIESKLSRCKKASFLAIALFNYELKFFKNCVNTASVFYKEKEIYFNTEFELVKSMKEDYLTFLICHEITHPLLKHDQRLKDKKNRALVNFSKDIEVDNLLSQLFDIIKNDLINVDGKTVPGNHIKPEFYNMTCEEIYDKLEKNSKSKSSEEEIDISDLFPDDKSGQKINKITDEITYKDKTYKIERLENKLINNNDNLNKKIPKENKAIETARRTMHNVMRSLDPKYVELKEYIEKLFKYETPWQKILKNLTTTHFAVKDKTSHTAINMINFVGFNRSVLLPGQDKKRKYKIIIFAIDESGSITYEDQMETLDIILQSKEYFKEIIVIRHSVQISKPEYYISKDIGETEKKNICTRKQCGGTSHKLVFEKIKDIHNKEGNNINLLICVTDLYSDIENYQGVLPSNLKVVYIATKEWNKRIIDKVNGEIIEINTLPQKGGNKK